MAMSSTSRRTTLGGLNASTLNQRASIGPSRVASAGPDASKRKSLGGPSLGPARPSTAAGGRPSMAGPGAPGGGLAAAGAASGPRRSSIMGKPSSYVRTDPRPVSDKAYLNSCIRTLITFLTGHGYDHAISPKLLTAPTSKDFLHIVQFLFRKIDPNIKFEAKVEDEVPLVFKRLKYPFQISKSALYAVGSPHTWPALLAALNWVVELLEYDTKAESARAQQDFEGPEAGGGAGSARVFFDYVSRSYGHFLAGDDYNCGLLDEELGQTFAARDADVSADVARLEADNARLSAELARLKGEPSPLAALSARRADFASDVDKFHKLIANLAAHKAAMQKKLAERGADLEAKAAELAAVRAQSSVLSSRVASQAVNSADVERMQKERSKAEEILSGVSGQKEALDRQVWEAEVQVERQLEELEATVRAYHALADRLKLIPASAKRAEGVRYEIALNTRAARTEDMVSSVDLKGAVRPGLARLREAYARRGRDAQAELLAAQEAAALAEEAGAEAAAAAREAERRAGKAEAHYRAERERLESEAQRLTEAAEEAEAAVAATRARGGASLAESEARARAAAAESEAAAAALAAERDALADAAVEAADLLMQHKACVEAALNSALEGAQAAYLAVKATRVDPKLLPLPTQAAA